MDAIERAIKALPGGQGELAKLLDVDPSYISQMKTKRRPIPAEHCPAIESATGVTCEELRPDVAWHLIRGKASAGAVAPQGG